MDTQQLKKPTDASGETLVKLGKKFDAYLKRLFVTESININILAYYRIRSTIKTLPATLPEPSSKRRVYWRRLSGRFGYRSGVGGGYTGLGSCGPDLSSGIGGGGGG